MDGADQKNQQISGQAVVSSSVSSQSRKEQEPITVKSSLELSEPELAISKELKDIGVESVPSLPNITETDRQAGITPSPQSAQVNIQPSGIVQLPLNQSEARDIVKSRKTVSDSIVWLANLVLKQFKRKR